jgi:hypothetical protein
VQPGGCRPGGGNPAHFAPAQVLKTPVFWIMYAMFVMVAPAG